MTVTGQCRKAREGEQIFANCCRHQVTHSQPPARRDLNYDDDHHDYDHDHYDHDVADTR